MNTVNTYQLILVVLIGVIVWGYFEFAKPVMKTRHNYKEYLEKKEKYIEELKSKNKYGIIQLPEKVGEFYMKTFQNKENDKFYGIILTKEMVDFYKTYLDKNDGSSLSLGFAIYDAAGLANAHLEDKEFERKQNNPDPKRQPDGKYGLMFGVVKNGEAGISPFTIGTDMIYDNWNQEWP